jgi:hypothetical protein
MTNDEFLDHVPWYQGLAWGALGRSGDVEMDRVGSKLFWLAPRYFAMMSLARNHPEEFAQLVGKYEQEAAERYNRKDWSREEPFPTVDVKEALRAYVNALESNEREGSNGDSTDTSD